MAGSVTMESMAMQAFATDQEIAAWRAQVKAEERNKTQKLDITEYLNYSNYSYPEHINYSNGTYSQGTVTYSENADRWNEGVQYTKNGYGDAYYFNQYAKGYIDHSVHEDKYVEYSRYSDYDDSHSNYGRTSYSRSSYGDAVYSQGYSQYTKANKVNTGFDHANYIPATPQLFKIIGSQVQSTADFILGTYDKNEDGYGSTDADSKKVLYTLKIKRVQDLNGKKVYLSSWKTLINKAATDRYQLDVSKYDEGVYEIEATAENPSRTQNGVTKTYVSDKLSGYFTICKNNAPVLTVLNGDEFINYAFGLDGKASPANVFTKYSETMFRNGSNKQQKGLFAEIKLTDADASQYHKAIAYLESASGTKLTKDYDVVFEKDSNGISPKKGNKTGVVFIPDSQYTDDGILEDVKLIVEVSDYASWSLILGYTSKTGTTTKSCPVMDGTTNISVIKLDNRRPTVSIPAAPNYYILAGEVTTASIIDPPNGKLGSMKAEYQIVKHGTTPSEYNWVTAANPENPIISITESGIWDIYVRALDKAGNLDAGAADGKITHSDNWKVTRLDMELDVPSVWYTGYPMYVTGIASCEHLKITDATFTLQGKSAVKGSLISTDGFAKTYDAKLPVDKALPEGDYVVYFKVKLENGQEQQISKVVTLKKTVPITITDNPVVGHTDQWNQNRATYNSQVSSSKRRADNVFWSGEKFCCHLSAYGITDGAVALYANNKLVKSAALKPSVSNALLVDTIGWSADLFDESWINKWGQKGNETLTFIFTLHGEKKQTKTVTVTITVNDVDKYFNIHEK